MVMYYQMRTEERSWDPGPLWAKDQLQFRFLLDFEKYGKTYELLARVDQGLKNADFQRG